MAFFEGMAFSFFSFQHKVCEAYGMCRLLLFFFMVFFRMDGLTAL
jgi:hypothetical protein